MKRLDILSEKIENEIAQKIIRSSQQSDSGRSALSNIKCTSNYRISILDCAGILRPERETVILVYRHNCEINATFTEPSGVAVNAQNDIIVADTNNHRIQVFDKEGRFKFQFGECGKRDGQLLYPNRFVRRIVQLKGESVLKTFICVAVNRLTGDFIVTERSPTHQIQIYNQYGQFLRKFGANILQHPRGVCVDSKGRIIVIEYQSTGIGTTNTTITQNQTNC
ncbi:B-box type zinc-finger protein ncl-1, putative [Brugia malayi]|uniref:B-box type zinc-finger protein ncl-1, putative n=1 Tax=Brugia malayi TaxID=6279 RepID=A0A4E9FU24_BRUMA|nr:B-box type zinc-finger protein ncl-1, putative [Brugia malayi]VIP00144.1 B-box type zinc-finger protein ncl-1, putative [Brugia malayi]